jgi:chromate transporter
MNLQTEAEPVPSAHSGGFKLQRDIFIGFFRSTMLGYGGGPSTIPLVHKEVVGTYKWMTNEEFGDVLALGNTLPGPIATKMAGYIGYRVGGIIGLINAIIATVVPTVILVIVLISALFQFKQFTFVQNITSAVTPVVGVMLMIMVYEFFTGAEKTLGWKATIILCVLNLVLLQILYIHPAIVIIAIFLVSTFWRTAGSKRSNEPGT